MLVKNYSTSLGEILMRTIVGCSTLALFVVFGTGTPRAQERIPAPIRLLPNANAAAHVDFERLPVVFEPNQGQEDARVRFVARGGYTAYLTDTDVIIDSHTATPIRMHPLCAKVPGSITGIRRTNGVTNYLTGSDATQWHTEI